MEMQNEAIYNKKTCICPICGEESDIFIFYEDKVVGCRHCGVHIPKRSNADRIRSMSDEELAEFLTPLKCVDCHLLDCGVEEEIVGNKPKRTCTERILDWLKQEATP